MHFPGAEVGNQLVVVLQGTKVNVLHGLNEQPSYYNRTFFQMKLVDKIIELPKISIRDLEQKVRNTHSPHAMPQLTQLVCQSQHQIAKEIKVVSPFYHRLDHHTGKCECQYHRMKRYKEGLSRLRLRHQGRSYNIRSSLEDSEGNIESNEAETDEAQSGGIKENRSAANLLQPLRSNVWNRCEKGQILKWKKEQKASQKIENQEFQLPKAARQQRYHTDWKLGEVNSKLNIVNPTFLNLISRRLENNAYKDKYLKMLFGFIKMKSNQDRLYLHRSKAYLKNSLNVLLNHFTMEKIIQTSELTQENIKKIAYHMACKESRVPEILEDLKKSVEEMQAYLKWVRKVKIEKQRKEQVQQNQLKNTSEKFEESECQKGSQQFLQEKYLVVVKNSKNDSSLLNEKGDDEKTQNQVKNWQNTGDQSYHSTNKYFCARKSHINLDIKDALEHLKQPEQRICFTQQSQLSNNDSKQRNMFVKQNSRGSKVFLHPNKNRSPRVTVAGTQNQNQMNCTGQSKFPRSKSKKNTQKLRKAQFNKRIQFLEFNPKYKDINYRQFCSKEEFMHLIQQIQRLDRNDQERAAFAFTKLKVDKFLDDPSRVDHLLRTFDALFNESCQQKIKKHIVAVRDKKYIEKLMKELDQTLNEVKRTDPRNLDTEELFPYRADKTLQQPHHKLRIAQYKGQHVIERKSIGGKIIYYEADEKVQRHITQELNQKMELQQANLDEIQSEKIDPSLTKVVDHRYYSKSKQNLKKGAYDRKEQKKILQYMHENHPNIFNYLNTSISQLCGALPPESQTQRD